MEGQVVHTAELGRLLIAVEAQRRVEGELVGEQPELFELGVIEKVCFVNLCGCPHNLTYVDPAVIRTDGWSSLGGLLAGLVVFA